MLPCLLLTRRLPDAVEARAMRAYQCRLNPTDIALTAESLLVAAEGTEALLVCPSDRLDAATIDRLPASLRMVATFSVGVDHIDLEAARTRGLVVSNTPDVLTDATADIAMLLILAAARRASEGERELRAGAWTGWRPTHLMGTHLGGKRLGIFGMGRIGRALAARARAFGMAIHYSNRSRLPVDLEAGAVFHADADDLVRVSDVLSLHAPASAATERFLNAVRLAMLPPGAIVVNTARGTLVDDDALIAALTSGRVAAAGLDVFAGEPNLHSGYLALPNACLLPHLGSATVETRNAMGFRALDNLDAFFAGAAVPDRVV